MSKRNKGGKAPSTISPEALESRVVAFAEQMGRIAGTVQAKTEGWMDRDALNKQIAGIRDGAAELLEHLSDGVTSMTAAAKDAEETVVAKAKSMSRGLVGAPGKKHRKPMPKDSRAASASAKKANLQSSRPMAKTTKLRGRG